MMMVVEPNTLLWRLGMYTVIVSSQYEVVIPVEIRAMMGIQPGQKFQIIAYENRITLIPFKEARDLRGFVKGINTTIDRENDLV
jgi:AbrB family looped-hinge helix DNA binding protein